jgi:hypothetical protein
MLRPLAWFRNEGYMSWIELREYNVIFRSIYGVSGRGIMSTALDGPTSEVNTSRNGIARRSAARRHPRRAGDVKIETKSRDQRYDNCVARVALERAPNGIFPSITPVRTSQSKTSTREACMVNSWNLAANCKYVVMSVCGPIQYLTIAMPIV